MDIPPSVVNLDGEFDVYKAKQAAAELAAADEAECAIVNLEAVRYFDASFLGALVRLANLRSTRGLAEPLLVVPDPFQRHLLEIAGLEERFTVFETLDEALEHKPAASSKQDSGTPA